MHISARNQIHVTITEIEEGAVNSVLILETAQGLKLNASITNDAVKELGLTKGEKAIAIIKASEVMIAK